MNAMLEPTARPISRFKFNLEEEEKTLPKCAEISFFNSEEPF